MKINFYSDPGHGWARVPKQLLTYLGIENKISSYSYMRGDFAYLEEDCDLSVLTSAMKEKGVLYSFREFVTNKSSKIRSYESYRSSV